MRALDAFINTHRAAPGSNDKRLQHTPDDRGALQAPRG